MKEGMNKYTFLWKYCSIALNNFIHFLKEDALVFTLCMVSSVQENEV